MTVLGLGVDGTVRAVFLPPPVVFLPALRGWASQPAAMPVSSGPQPGPRQKRYSPVSSAWSSIRETRPDGERSSVTSTSKAISPATRRRCVIFARLSLASREADPGRLGVQKVMQQHAVQHRFQPDLHRAGQRPRRCPPNAERSALFGDFQPQIGPPPSPVGRIPTKAPTRTGSAATNVSSVIERCARPIASHTAIPAAYYPPGWHRRRIRLNAAWSESLKRGHTSA